MIKVKYQRVFGVFLLFFIFSTASVFAEEHPLAVQGVKAQHLENPPSKDDILKGIGRGVNFILSRQNENGSWGTPKQTKQLNIYAPGTSHDAFRAGTTALCLWALLEVEQAAKQNNAPFSLKELGIDSDRLTSAIDKCEWWMRDNIPKLRRSADDALYNVWGHIYSIHSLLKMEERYPDDKERKEQIHSLIVNQIEKLQRYETLNGGWFYYDDGKTARPSETTASFVSAAGLIALKEAQKKGIEVPQKLIDTTMSSLKRQRLGDFSYLYGEYLWKTPRQGINRPAGSLGRSQSCNLAMRIWGDKEITDEVLINWLNRLYARNGWLDVGRKRPRPHESHFQIAGYFFYYAHFYAALCIQELPEKEQPVFKEFLADVLLGLQEKDGSWWDFPLYDYHQQYGSGFAVLSLLRTL
ncbi:hypothetical protein FACS1894214_3690 [Planctomycetales bacterium]|nr:hypothetical protein FACS1894214_3690 [Planctomycetales bacterium]